MSDLLDADQVTEVRQVMTDLSDTFAFPVVLKKTTFTEGAFATDPSVSSTTLKAIRTFGSSSETDRFRNALGPAGTHEYDIYINWELLEDNDLIDENNKALIDHNDLIEMEGEIYEIVAFGGIAEITKKPAFLQIRIRRRFEDPDGANAV